MSDHVSDIEQKSESSSIMIEFEKHESNDINKPGIKEVEELRKWTVNNKIPYVHVDKLLKILKPRLLRTIPLRTKTLL